MVPAFAEAAFALKAGQITQTPVHTQFGWLRHQGHRAPHRTAGDVRASARRPAPDRDPGRRPQGPWAEARTGLQIETLNMDGTPQTPAPTGTAAPRGPPRPLRRSRPSSMAKAAVSPMAVTLPSPAAHRGRAARGGGGRHPLPGPDRPGHGRLAPGTTVAGVFTRSLCPGAPDDWCRLALKQGQARGVVVNARQRQRLHRPPRPRDHGGDPPPPPPALPRLPGGAGVPRQHRRDRRGAAARTHHTTPCRRCTPPCAKTRGSRRRAAS